MRITFCLIALAALIVAIWALCKDEYVIAFAMLFVIGLQAVNLTKYKKRRHGR